MCTRRRQQQQQREWVQYVCSALPMSFLMQQLAALMGPGGTLTFTFSSRLEETHVQRRFFRTLADEGLDVRIETNGIYGD